MSNAQDVPAPCTLDCMSSLRIAGRHSCAASFHAHGAQSAAAHRRPAHGGVGVARGAARAGSWIPLLSPPMRMKSPKRAARASIPVVMTSPACPSGSDRVREVARQIDADIYVNIQGDEPTLTPDFFPPLLELFERAEVEVAHSRSPLPA